MELKLKYDPFEAGFVDNPYIQLGRLREQEPVHFSEYGTVMFFRYPEVRQMLTDPGLSADDRHAESRKLRMIRDAGVGTLPPEGTMPRVDPPEHTRLRRLVQMAFTPRAIEQMRPYTVAATEKLLDRMAGMETCDLIREFAYGLPFNVISEMLGIPDEDRADLNAHTHAIVRMMDIALTNEHIYAADRATRAVSGYLGAQIDKKRQNPSDDIISAMIVAEESGEVLTKQEIIDQTVLLYTAGHETTMNLIGNGVVSLLRHPEQLELLKTGQADVKNAVEEFLRYDSPVQMHARVTREEPYVFGGVEIPANTVVIGHCGAANHDPERFGDRAGELDITRENARQHLSFGFGIHHCIGAALTRLEGEVAFELLLERFPNLSLVPGSEPAFRNNQFFRGLETLPVRLEA